MAEGASDSVGFFGVDFTSAAAPRDWKLVERQVGVTVLERSGYHAKRVPDDFTRMETYVGARFLLGGRVLRLLTSVNGSDHPDSSAVAVSVQWTLFDAAAHLVAFRGTEDVQLTCAGGTDTAVTNAVTQALSDFLGRDSVRSLLKPSAPPPNAEWSRPVPSNDSPIELFAADRNVDIGRSALEGSLSGVVSLRGPAGIGSALVIAKSGLALTNYHVVHNQRSLMATFLNGSTTAVRVIRTDSVADLALVEVACAAACHTVDLYSGTPPLGSDVFAIGSPVSEQFSHTVTKGIVSAIRQHGVERLIQTDAALNPGNSGGPLVDAQTARAIGIVSHKLMVDGTEGIGFAILIDDALRLLNVRRAATP
jgi:S1-C subfamily serine protease